MNKESNKRLDKPRTDEEGYQEELKALLATLAQGIANNNIVRTISSHSHRQKQEDTEDDRISMYADDSSTFIAHAERQEKQNNPQLRKINSGATTWREDNTDETGRTRRKDITSKQLGVDFKVMSGEDRDDDDDDGIYFEAEASRE